MMLCFKKCFATPKFRGPHGWDVTSVWNYLTNNQTEGEQVVMRNISGYPVWTLIKQDGTIVAKSNMGETAELHIEDINDTDFTLHGPVISALGPLPSWFLNGRQQPQILFQFRVNTAGRVVFTFRGQPTELIQEDKLFFGNPPLCR